MIEHEQLTEGDLKEIERFCESAGGFGALGQALEYLPRLVARIRELEAALEPFADKWAELEHLYADIVPTRTWTVTLLEGSLARAAEALRPGVEVK